MKIISGKTGTPHMTSAQFRQIIEGIIGQESYILKSGENMEPELASNNMLKIRGGVMSHHGNVSGVDLNTYDEVTIKNGSQGMKRIDLIVNRYTRSDETGIEKNEWVVLTGTPDQSSPKVPVHIVGNLQNGDLTDDCPVFKVHLEGIQVTKVEKLLPVLEGDLASLNSNLEGLFQFKKISGEVMGLKVPHMIRVFGSVVLTASTEYRKLFTINDILNNLKAMDSSIERIDMKLAMLTVFNGDSFGQHYYNAEYWNTDRAYYIYMNPTTTGPVRVNYCFDYFY